jgi:hypothetical protein
MGTLWHGTQRGVDREHDFFYLTDADEWQDEQRTRIRRTALEYADTGDFVDDNQWTVQYPEPLTRWLASMVELYKFQKTPLEILDCERRYPGLQDDIFTQIGYRAHMKSLNEDDE